MRGARMLVRGQKLADLRMSESVVVGSFLDGTDPESGDPIRVLDVSRYSGVGRIRWASREVSNSSASGSPVALQEPYLSVPFGSARLFTGDEVECTGSSDPLLVGRRFKVSGTAAAGQVTAYRYPLEELS